MSETDDTDELLLIPPDLYIKDPPIDHISDNPSPYFSVVDSLITQVSQLENRINLIQSSSELNVSLTSNSSDMNTSPWRLRKVQSHEDLPRKIDSPQTTPNKLRTKFTLNSLPNSPNVAKVHPKKQTAKNSEVNPMLGEIDHFLSNVKQIKRFNAVRNLDIDFSSLDSREKNLDVNQVDLMLQEMELQQQKIERMSRQLEKPIVKEQSWQPGDNAGSVPDNGTGMRKNMYRTDSVTEIYSKHKRGDGLNQSPESSRANDSDSSDSTQMTAFDRCKLLENMAKSNGETHFDLGLLSLSKLWKNNDHRDLPPKFQQKLQEEKMRRQHCEQVILDLQNRLLELQERMSVALQVDEAKDKAIIRFHESWERTGAKLEDIEKDKQMLEDEVVKLKTKMSEDTEEMSRKISHFEREKEHALEAAQINQNKFCHLEKRFQELEEMLRMSQTNSEEFQSKYLVEAEKNRQFPEIIAQKELQLNESRNLLTEAKNEVLQSKACVDKCQSELQAMKSENSSLVSKMEAEKEANRKLQDQKKKLLEEVNANKNVQKSLQDELTKTREQLENSKLDLKNYYQGQVEIVVQSKLKEFQNQLDDAEKNLKEEMTRKELSIAKLAASHIQQITDKHSLEIRLLEEKHQEEGRLYKLQMAQLQRDADEANQRLKRHQNKNDLIEKQLHKFMESLRQDHVTTVEEINSFRTRSFSNLEELLVGNPMEEEKKKRKEENGEPPATYRMGETPRRDKETRRKENNFQETIQMLLDKRQPGESRGYDDSQQQVTRDGVMSLYHKSRGKQPWK